MDACTDPRVETIIGCFPVQMGKTEVLLNFLGYIVDQDPGPIMVVYPTERDSDKTVRNRIHPMFLEPKSGLRRHLPEGKDELPLKEIHFDRCTLYAAWSNSPAALASTPIRYVVNDEVDKFPPFAGREANPIKLSEMRTSTFRGRKKILVFSTPTTEHGYIWGEFIRTDCRQYWIPCGRCGAYFIPDFYRDVKWPEGSTSAGLKADQTAWLECPTCHGRMLEQEKGSLLLRGRWAPAGVTVNAQGELEGELPPRTRTGFHLSSVCNPWVTFSDLGSEFLEAKGDAGRMMNFTCSRLALPWKDKVDTILGEHLLVRRKAYRSGGAPAPATRITAGVDVQADHLWLAIRAWGPGEASWLVRWGSVATLEDLERAILGTKYKLGDTLLQVERGLIDSGHRTEEIYQFAKKHRPLFFPSKGMPGGAPIKIARPRPGILLFDFAVDFWKDKLARFIRAKDGEQGEWNLPQDVDETYLRQMVSERRVYKRSHGRTVSTWEPVTEHAPNHLWDAEVLNLVCADSIGIRFEGTAEARAATPAAPPPARREDSRGGEKRGWMEGEHRGPWMGEGRRSSFWET